MVSPSTISPAKGRPTIFGNVSEKNIVFLIDTSGSMYHSLDVVKEHLLETLISRSTSGRDTMFNVISFDESVSKWADRLIQCTPRTVSSASQWIHGLKCGTSTNTMEALLQAYEDDGLDAIYLVTDGLPDQRTSVILENIHRVHKGRPVHATYITGVHSDPAAMEFLESLARETKGSLHIISLTLTGAIKKVTPVYNEKTQYIRNYEGSFLDNIHERPSSAPPSTGIASFSYDPHNSVRILHAPHGPVPIPYVPNTYYRYDKPRGYSKILDYADSVLASRGLSQFVARAVSTVPVAASIIKGTKFLARREADGLFYIATVKEQATNENFILDFHKCPALQQSFVQETPIFDCIAMKDAMRQPICIGDKVLAPWQPDGRYGPGTVLDGVDRRNSQPPPPGFEQLDGGSLLVAFFNGETKEVAPRVAVRIPLNVFNRIVTELQLPESQRRRIRLASKTTTPEYNGISPPPETTWQRPFSPPKTIKKPILDDSDALLKAKIEHQLQRNRHLLGDMRLERNYERTNESGVSDRLEKSGKSVQFLDSGEVEIEDKYYRSYADREPFPSRTEVETIDVGIGTEERDFNKYVGRTVQVGVPVAKAGGGPEKKKRWRTWSSGVPPRPPRFRETMLSKPAEAKDDKIVRPSHQEYQTFDGVGFPSGTDKKFSSELWHPYHGHALGEQKPSRDQSEPKLKHHEYRSSTGVPFPPAADRKFAAGGNPNWSPDNVGSSVQRSTCWENGLGKADNGAVLKDKQKIERKRHVAEQYNKRIKKDVIEKETKESERRENQRNKTFERNNRIAEDVADKDKKRSSKFEFKKQSSQKARENETNKETQAVTRESERRTAIKNRTEQHQKMEQSFEKAAQDYNQQRQDGLKEREQKRYEAHHNRLVSESQSAEQRERRLKVQAKARDNKLEKIKSDSERYKEMRLSIKKQNRDNKQRNRGDLTARQFAYADEDQL